MTFCRHCEVSWVAGDRCWWRAETGAAGALTDGQFAAFTTWLERQERDAA